MNKYKQYFVWFCFSVFLILPPFLLGGVYSHTGTNLLIMFILSVVSLFFLIYLITYKKKLIISSIVFPLCAILIIAFFQLIPLPLTVLKFLTPKGHFFHMIEGSGARPLTMSIPDTFYSILRVSMLIFFSTIVARTVYAGNKKWKQILIDTIIFISTGVIILSAALKIIHAKTWLYGTLRHQGFLFEPVLINSNHAACFLGISALLALTSIYTSDFSRKKIFYGGLFFLHSIAVVATLSRGGILAYAVSLLFFLVISKNFEKEKHKFKTYLTLSALLLAMFVVFHTGHSLLKEEFNFQKEGYFNKIEEIQIVKKYFYDFWLTGSGLGSFSKVYTYYQNDPEKRFTELENEPIQFILENGIVPALFIFAFLVFVIITSSREKKRNKGLLSVLIFVLMHNTVDFNLHNFSTLFPVVAILVLLTEPVHITGKKMAAFIAFLFFLSFLTIYATLSEKGNELTGYSKNLSYEKSVYYYPSDYTIPMDEAIRRLNSGDLEKLAFAGIPINSTIAKSPLYYYTYYLSGNYMLRLGSVDNAMIFFKKCLDLSDTKYSTIIRKIYTDLVLKGIGHRIIELVDINKNKQEDIERFLFEISKTEKNSLNFIFEHENYFFISAIKSYLDNNEFDKAEKLIDEIKSSKKELSEINKGKLMIYKGLIYQQKGSFKKAYENISAGAKITGNFSDYLTAANVSLKLDKQAIDNAEKNLKVSLLKSSMNLGLYYRWLSRREFLYNNYADGVKYLEKAANVSGNPGIRFELANIFSKRGMHFIALKHFNKLKKEFPSFKTETIDLRIKDETEKLSKKEKENYQELMLRTYE